MKLILNSLTMKKIFILLFIALNIGSYSQLKEASFKFSNTTITPSIQVPSEQHYTNEICLSHQLDVNHNKNKNYRLARESARNLINQTIQKQSLNRAAPPIYSIPVVFHVIHKGEPVGSVTNISDAQLMSAIDALNRDYRKTSADGGIAQGIGADTEIEFCLASKDPSGNPHSGINRVDGTSVTNYAVQGIT